MLTLPSYATRDDFRALFLFIPIPRTVFLHQSVPLLALVMLFSGAGRIVRSLILLYKQPGSQPGFILFKE